MPGSTGRPLLAAAAVSALALLTSILVQPGAAQPLAPSGIGIEALPSATEPSAEPTSSAPGTDGPVVPVPDVATLLPELPETPAERPDRAEPDSGTVVPERPRSIVGEVLFESSFEDGLAPWRYIHNEDAGVRIVNSPAREGGSAVQLTANGGGDNRAQLDGPVILNEGEEAFIGWSTYFPEDLPDLSGWSVFFQLHGEPFGASPSVAFGFDNGRIKFGRGADYGYDVPWSMPLERGRWIDFVMHVGMSASEEDGFVELWVDGRQQSLHGVERLRTSTMWDNQNEGLFPCATAYYESGPTVRLFHDAIRVANTYDAAAPR